jgi:hypothetical protein
VEIFKFESKYLEFYFKKTYCAGELRSELTLKTSRETKVVMTDVHDDLELSFDRLGEIVEEKVAFRSFGGSSSADDAFGVHAKVFQGSSLDDYVAVPNLVDPKMEVFLSQSDRCHFSYSDCPYLDDRCENLVEERWGDETKCH